MAAMKTGTLVLTVVLSTIGLMILVAIGLALWFLRGGPVDISESATAGTSVSVELRNTAITLEPSRDDRVHVRARGTFAGERPRVSVGTVDTVTSITGGCPSAWLFRPCSLRVTVSLPADLAVRAVGGNGAISAADLTGALRLTTTNGLIEITGAHGPVDARTTNGVIRVQAAQSGEVRARTTNGSVRLDFSRAPLTVEARSTNGAVTVVVPDDGTRYRVDAQTTNGSVQTDSVPTDRRADRAITVQTTNGSVTVETR